MRITSKLCIIKRENNFLTYIFVIYYIFHAERDSKATAAALNSLAVYLQLKVF